MSNATRRIIKKQLNQLLNFDSDMYNNIYGSIVICGYMFSENKPDKDEIKKKWRKVVRSNGKGIDWSIEDKDFIDKTLEYFGMKRPVEFPVAFIQSKTNCLIAPYINETVLPLREDGLKGYTLCTGKVYPLYFNEE